MRGKTVTPPEGAQASQGQVRQVSKLFGEAIGDTHEWARQHSSWTRNMRLRLWNWSAVSA